MEFSSNPRVVIVDDEQPILDVMRVKLGAAGFDVHVADNGIDGWELIQSLTPNVAIVDFHMPGLNGIEVCQHMLAEAKTSEIPVIAITSKWENNASEMQAMPNVVEFVPKPFSSRKLITLVRRLAGVTDPTPRLGE